MEYADSLLSVVRTVVMLLVTLTVLVAVHELGHYLFARWSGMHVKAFAVMMGGIRRTDLAEHLPRPLAPALWVWIAGLVSFVVLSLGLLMAQSALTIAGFVLCAFVVPIWVAKRLEALYHLANHQGLMYLIWSWGVGVVLLFVGTRFQADMTVNLGMLLSASLVGLTVLYYRPVLGRPEGAEEMGHGEITVWDKEGKVRKMAVRYRPLWARTSKSGTEFSLLALPLGGFAAIKGMHPKEDGSEVSVQNGFFSKSPVARLAVLFAGPLFSIVFGILLMFGNLTLIGEPVISDDPTISVVEKGPAETAGMKDGDRIVAINGTEVNDFYGVMSSLRDQVRESTVDGKTVLEPIPTDVTYERDGERITATVTPKLDDTPQPVIDEEGNEIAEPRVQARIGVMTEAEILGYEPLPAGAALAKSVAYPVELVKRLGEIVVKPAKAKDTLGGPVTMAQTSSFAASKGLYWMLSFAAMLSISLGVLNLLPFPPLDGGQMVIAFIELLRGNRRLGIAVQERLQLVGMILVALLMVATISIDLGRQTPAAPADQTEIAPEE